MVVYILMKYPALPSQVCRGVLMKDFSEVKGFQSYGEDRAAVQLSTNVIREF